MFFFNKEFGKNDGMSHKGRSRKAKGPREAIFPCGVP